MDVLRQDIRYAIHSLARQKAFAIPALLTLALAIGVNTAMFSVVNAVLVRQFSYPDASRLVRISEVHRGGVPVVRQVVVGSLIFDAWRRSPRTLEAMGTYSERAYTVSGDSDAEYVRGASLSPEMFSILRVSPVAGRFFDESETQPGADAVVVVSHGYWQDRLGGRTDAIGQMLTLDGRRCRVIGIAPAGFSFPDRDRRLFTPFVVPPVPANASASDRFRIYQAIGRLAPGVSVDQAAAEGTSVAVGVGPSPVNADTLLGSGPVEVHVRTLLEETTGSVRLMLVLLTVGVGLVLVVACANVANLFLSYGAARQREMAVRGAIGASRGRVVRQLLTESVTLSVIGGAIGVALALALVHVWPSIAPRDFPRVEEVVLDAPAVAFAVVLSVLSGIVAGVIPAFQSTGTDVVTALREGSGASTALRGTRVRRVLLVIEAGLAMVLLVGAALLIRSFVNLTNKDTGFTAGKVLTARISLQGGPVTPARWQQVASAVVERVQGLPGVEAVGASSMAPLGDSNFIIGFHLAADRPQPIIARALGYVISPGYEAALRLRLRQGRHLDASDVGTPVQAMLVNEDLVRTYLNDGKPVLGRRFTNVFQRPGDTEIVGVVGNVLKNGPTDRPQPEFYLVLGHQGLITLGRQINIVARTTNAPAALSNPLRAVVREIEPQAAVHNVNVLADEVAQSVGQPRFVATILGTFAGLALSLAAVGVYGVLSYGVSRRRREFGVRMALGGTRAHVIWLVFREGMLMTCSGLVLGLLAGVALTRVMRALLVGIDSLDVASFAAAAAVLGLVATIACLVPAWRGSATMPIDALRHE